MTRLELIKQQVRDGSYRIDAGALADALVHRLFQHTADSITLYDAYQETWATED